MTKTLALVDHMADIDKAVTSCAGCIAGRSFTDALTLANGMQRIRDLITPEVLAPIMSLQGSALGFRTDKDPVGYPPDQVRDAIIEAVMRGASPVGNEFNVIAGRAYLTREFFHRALAEFPGMSDLRVSLGLPRTSDGGAVVPWSSNWTLSGKADSLEGELVIRVNKGQGADAILGKADRKARAAIYRHITGSESAADGEVGDILPAPPVLEDSKKIVEDALAGKSKASESLPF